MEMDIPYNTHCYTFEELNYTKGFLDPSVDATYIIHLKNNGRMDAIQDQLESFQPTSTVFIVHNQGFKTCNKRLIEQVSYQDLTDAFLQCFKHADERGYGNILILEDDFIFADDIKNPMHLDNINSFLIEKKHENMIYYLGCIPIIIAPCQIIFQQYYSFKSCCTHAIIYSQKVRKANLNLNLKHWDVIIENGVSSRYLYYKPLCYQTFPETENKQTWGAKDNQLVVTVKNWTIKMLNLDKTPEPGYAMLYAFSKVLGIVLLYMMYLFAKFLLFYFGYIYFFIKNKLKIKKK
jgi:hypothetical protein